MLENDFCGNLTSECEDVLFLDFLLDKETETSSGIECRSLILLSLWLTLPVCQRQRHAMK